MGILTSHINVTHLFFLSHTRETRQREQDSPLAHLCFMKKTWTKNLGKARLVHSVTAGLAAAGHIHQDTSCNLLSAYYVLQFCKGDIVQVRRDMVTEHITELGWGLCSFSWTTMPPVKTLKNPVLNQFNITSMGLPPFLSNKYHHILLSYSLKHSRSFNHRLSRLTH